MIRVLCFLLPPVFFMYMREKVLGNKISCSFNKEWIHFIKEYLLSVCLLNFVSISVTYLLFKHTGSMVSSLNEHTDFAFHYMLLSLALAAAEPVLENLIRYHFNLKNNKEASITIKGSTNLNEDEINRMVKEAEENKEKDAKIKEQTEIKYRAESLISTLERSLTDEKAKSLPEEQKQTAQKQIDELKDLLKNEK